MSVWSDRHRVRRRQAGQPATYFRVRSPAQLSVSREKIMASWREWDRRRVLCLVDSGCDITQTPNAHYIAGVDLIDGTDHALRSDPCGHGTQMVQTVCAIAGAIDLVLLRVLDEDGVLQDWAIVDRAFQWIWDHRDLVGPGVVLLGIADQSVYADDLEFRGTAVQHHIAALGDAGVPTIAPAGNNPNGYRHPGMAWPAILRETISVGADRTESAAPVSPTPAEPQRLADARRHCHLPHDPITGCGTRLLAEPQPPGMTSGAAAAIAGALLKPQERTIATALAALLREQAGRVRVRP